jgi:hypothetical protein
MPRLCAGGRVARRMGGANGSRECAPDDKFRVSIVANVSVAQRGVSLCSTPTLRASYSSRALGKSQSTQ